jgi:hypothetical protein
MIEREALARHLARMEQDLKELLARYEKYFAGVEKREPLKDRETLAGRLRGLANRQIVQTDLRFKFQNLAARFHTYGNYWDRVLRLMDEGKLNRRPKPEPSAVPEASEKKENPPADVLALHRDLLAAHQSCRLGEKAPDLTQVADFLSQQREKIKEKFGDRAVEFRVVMEEGKPKIRVRVKNSEE